MINYIYLLKMMVCSLVLTSYYFIVLRNKVYHQYNRWYLICSLLASWLIPSIPLNIFVEQHSFNSYLYNALDLVTKENYEVSNNLIIQNSVNKETSFITLENITIAVFVSFSLYFVIVLLAGLFKINSIKKKYTAYRLYNCTIYLTNEKYTPYSFFKTIFWNKKIDIESSLGKQILQHELVHIQQKHSLDKLFIQLNLIVGWFNPFFWIIKSELEMIHEFIADRNSIPNGDTSKFAQMILSVTQVNKSIPITNPFFFSPIKRRLQMLGQKKSAQYNYLQKLLALPLLLSLVALLSFKTKQKFEIAKHKYTPIVAINKSTTQNGSEFVEKEKTKKAVKSAINITNNKQIKDTTIKGIDELRNEFLQLEKQYKQEVAIANERKKLMLLIQQQQNLNDDQMLNLFKAVINLDNAVAEVQKQQTKNLKTEYEEVLGSSNFKKFWNARNELKKETLNYLKN